MKQAFFYLTLSAFCCSIAFGQVYLDSVQKLDEIVISNKLLSHFSTGQKTLRLKDSVLRKNPANLTDLLNFNTAIHFNQNGYGMVASPAFRGTTAQQTAVVWNGININSQFNGQADFNTLLNPILQQISIQPGGGSVIYGTAAIGGSIHLENQFKFTEEVNQFFQINYGSFNTFEGRYLGQFSTEKWSFSFGYQRNTSANDFPIHNSDRSNINGQFNNNSLGFDAAYRLNDKHQFKFFSWLFLGDRNLSVIRPSDTKSNYQNQDLRTLLEWEYIVNHWRSSLKVGYLNEDFRFTQNIEREENYTSNVAETALARYYLKWEDQKWVFSTLIDANMASASGDNLQEDRRDVAAIALLGKRKLNAKWIVEASLRQEVSNLYNSPILYNLGTDYRFSKQYLMKLHTSKNFRIPTFNDLFWETSGNATLLPETAYQIEWGHHFSLDKFRFAATGFYNYINDLIRWIPNENVVWQPENVDEVRTYGVELEAGFSKKWDTHQLYWNAQYAYTVSENRQTGFQLRYIPYHKASTSLAYHYNRWQADMQWIYVGEAFTRSNNAADEVISAYGLQHIGIRYQLLKTSPQLHIGAKAFNVWDVDFQGVENRPMPGRYYQFQFLLTI